MGYSTIASNGATHGSKAQTIYSYKPKIYMQIQGKHDFTHRREPLEHLIKTKCEYYMPEGKFKPHNETPKPKSEDITQPGWEITSISLLECLPYTIDII